MAVAPLNSENLCADPQLHDLPYRIELNRFHQIVLSPINPLHGRYQAVVARRLDDELPRGRIFYALPIETADNVK